MQQKKELILNLKDIIMWLLLRKLAINILLFEMADEKALLLQTRQKQKITKQTNFENAKCRNIGRMDKKNQSEVVSPQSNKPNQV